MERNPAGFCVLLGRNATGLQPRRTGLGRVPASRTSVFMLFASSVSHSSTQTTASPSLTSANVKMSIRRCRCPCSLQNPRSVKVQGPVSCCFGQNVAVKVWFYRILRSIHIYFFNYICQGTGDPESNHGISSLKGVNRREESFANMVDFYQLNFIPDLLCHRAEFLFFIVPALTKRLKKKLTNRKYFFSHSVLF